MILAQLSWRMQGEYGVLPFPQRISAGKNRGARKLNPDRLGRAPPISTRQRRVPVSPRGHPEACTT